MSSNDIIDQKLKLADAFNREIAKLLRLADQKMPSLDMDQIRRLISLGKSSDPLLLIDGSEDLLWQYKNEINAENDQFFLNMNYKKEIKHPDSISTEFIEKFIGALKTCYLTLSKNEKKVIWTCLKSMLKCVIEYKLLLSANDD